MKTLKQCNRRADAMSAQMAIMAGSETALPSTDETAIYNAATEYGKLERRPAKYADNPYFAKIAATKVLAKILARRNAEVLYLRAQNETLKRDLTIELFGIEAVDAWERGEREANHETRRNGAKLSEVA